MKRLLRILAILLLLAAAVLGGAWLWFDDEHRELDAETRAGFGESFVDLADGTVHYELGGPPDGKPVVLVHGFSVPSYIWDPTFEFLANSGYRVLRFDLYGRGHSDRPDTDYDFDLFARQLAQLVDALDLRTPFDLVGLSMGGPITTRFASRHPESVSALVLVDPMVVGPTREDIALLDMPVIGPYMANVYLLPRVAAGQTDDFLDKSRFPDWEARFREQMQYRGFRRAIRSTVREFPDADILGEYEKLGRSGIPVYLIWGREDPTVPLALSEKVLERVPQAELAVVDDAGHLPQLEQTEMFNALLLERLSATDPR